MTNKLFEEEVGHTLMSLKDRCFYLKPLDGVMWAASRVDFHCVILGRGVNIEAKEIKGTERFNVTTNVTPNQLMCLRDTETAGGLGLLLVNFGRLRGTTSADRSRGFMSIYRYQDLEKVNWPTPRNPWVVTPDDAFETVFPLPGRLWETGWLDRLLRKET